MGIGAIVDGHVKEAFGLNKDISQERLDICNKCPLLKQTVVGPVCNNKLYLNIETGETSERQKEGFRRGCGCRLNAKTRLPYAVCPLGKW